MRLPLARLAPLVVVLLAFAAFSNGAEGAFVFDDHTNITGNAAIRSLWPPWRIILDQGQSGISGRPLVALSYALNHALCGYETAGWHWVNVGLHAAASLALLGCLRRALRLPRFAARFGRHADALGLAVAAAWAVHPLATTVVMFRGQRVEGMMVACFLATLYCALRAFAQPGTRLWTRLAVLACALGTGCKEVIVGAPVLVLAFDALFVAGSWREALALRRSLHVGLFCSWALIALWVALAGGRSESVGFGYGEVGPWEYLTTQAWAVPHYLKLALWPHPLVFDYGKRPITELSRWLPGACVVLALLSATAVGLARRRGWGFLGACWFVVLAPTSSVLPIVTELIVEHRAYLPSAAVLTLVGLGVVSVLERAPRWRWVASGATAAAITALALATRARNEDYRTEIGLWADTVAKLPENDRAQACYGNDLRVAGRIEEAGARYREAVRLAPEDPYWAANWGTWLLDQGRVDEAIAELERSRALLDSYGMTLQNLGSAYSRRGEFELAIATWQAALDHGAPAPGWVARQLAALLAPRGREAEAQDAWRRAATLAPSDPDLQLELARALLRPRDAGLVDAAGARAAAERAVALRNGLDADALELAGEAAAALGQRSEAAALLRRCAALRRALGDGARARQAEERADALGGALPPGLSPR